MTGYTVHTGASKKFVSGWDKVFAAPTAKKSASNAGNASSTKSAAAKSKKGKKSK